MTNGWIDIQNTDMMLIMGGNPAENHPCGFKWPIEAKRKRNAKMIVVDPRFTRTAAAADLFVQIRAGSDIAFLGGMIRYAIENQRIAHDYLIHYTNAAFLVQEGFKLPEDGLFSGFDARHRTPTTAPPGITKIRSPRTTSPSSIPARSSNSSSSTTRATPPRWSSASPAFPKTEFLKAADLFTSIRKDGDMKKAATIIYAVGWTQHSSGTQTIRTAAILQLLLGNVGRAGGGVNALRGHSNIQGATDMAGIFDILPGYLKMPNARRRRLQVLPRPASPQRPPNPPRGTPSTTGPTPPNSPSPSSRPCTATPPKRRTTGPSTTSPKSTASIPGPKSGTTCISGHVKGLLAFGMNGVAIGPNSQKNIDALKKADWLVVCEIYPDETSEFWKSPGITADEMKQIPTTVYRLPGAGFAEKDGTFVNSARWLQWKNAAVPPPGQAKLDQEILARIFLKVRELYQKEGGKFPDPILHATWNYTDPHNPSLAEVAREINGRDLSDRASSLTAGCSPALTARRRHHLQRQLALLRLLDRSRRHDAAPRHRRSLRSRRLSQLGMVVARQPPRALQPRLLRSRRQPLGPRPQADLVERIRSSAGSATTCPISRPTRRPRTTWAPSS